MVFRTALPEYRARANLTQQELADLVGVRRETIVHLEKGQYNPSLKLAVRIAKALNATVESLFFFDE